jgi:hypothetical protein
VVLGMFSGQLKVSVYVPCVSLRTVARRDKWLRDFVVEHHGVVSNASIAMRRKHLCNIIVLQRLRPKSNDRL